MEADPLVDSAGTVVQVRIFENQKLNGRVRGWNHMNISPSDFHGKPFLLSNNVGSSNNSSTSTTSAAVVVGGLDHDDGVGLYRYTDEAGTRALGTLRLDAVRPKAGFEWVSPWHILKSRGHPDHSIGNSEEGFVYGPSLDELKLSFYRKLQGDSDGAVAGIAGVNADGGAAGGYIARRRVWVREMVQSFNQYINIYIYYISNMKYV